MYVGRPTQNRKTDTQVIKTCNMFKYLETTIASSGTCEREILATVAMGK